MSLSYREFIECRYIGLFRISKSISYRTFHIEYLDILKTNDFFVFFRRKFQKFSDNSENSPKIQKTHEPKLSTTTTAPKIPKIRRKFWKFAENSLKIPQKEGLLWGPRIVSYRIEKKILISYRVEKKLIALHWWWTIQSFQLCVKYNSNFSWRPCPGRLPFNPISADSLFLE